MKTSHVYIIFADISFLLCGILCLGYVFVDVKRNEPERVLFEKGIEFPALSRKSEVYAESSGSDSIEIVIPRNGGRYIVEGESVLKTEIGASLMNVKDKPIILHISPKAPSEDTLYLYDILNGLNANVTVLHWLEENQNEK